MVQPAWTPSPQVQRVGVARVPRDLPQGHTYNMAPGLWSTAPPAGRKFLVELGCRACSWYTVRQSLLRLM